MSNFSKMTPQWLQNDIRKKFKLLKYEHIISSFKARNLEILRMQLLFNFAIFGHLKKVRKICFCSYFLEI